MIDTGAIEACKAVDMIGLAERYTTLRKVTPREYAGACPRCGGRDRFRVNLDRGWFCRHCQGEPGAGGHWGDQIDLVMWLDGVRLKEAIYRLTGRETVSAETLQRLAAERQARQEERELRERHDAEEAERILTERAEWKEYAAHPFAEYAWAARGVRPEWVDYYKLGYCEGRQYKVGDETITSDSLTIPYFRATFDTDPIHYRIIDMKHRLLKTDASGGKYRHHVSGCGNNLFFADILQRGIMGDLLIVEGEIKAIITWQACWINDQCAAPFLTVVSVPGKNWKPEWIEDFRRSERVFVALDPDANNQARTLAAQIGENARPLLLPGKIDDLILLGALDCPTLLSLLDSVWR